MCESPDLPTVVARADSIVCASDNRPRLVAVLAYPAVAGTPEQTVTADLRRAVLQAGEVVRARSVQLSRVRVRLRVACDRLGAPTVLRLPLPPEAAARPGPDTFRTLLQALPRPATQEKYLVYYTAPSPRGVSGEGDFAYDDRSGRDNANNRRGTVAVQYRLLVATAYARPHWSILLHEYLHTLGAVQVTAPHSDGTHVSGQAHDVMGSGLGLPELTPTCSRVTLDCGGDDYFHPAPRRDSYLDTHWNVAGLANAWVQRG